MRWLFLLIPNLIFAQIQVQVSWDANTESDLAGYKVYYGTESRVYTTVENVGNVTSATFTGFQEGNDYFFAVTAYDDSGNESGFSDEVVLEIPLPDTEPPFAPVNFSGTVVSGNVSLSWNQNTDDAVGYLVSYGGISGQYSKVVDVGNVTSHVVSGLTPGFTYYFVVQAYDQAQNISIYSNEISIPLTEEPPPDTQPPAAPVNVRVIIEGGN